MSVYREYIAIRPDELPFQAAWRHWNHQWGDSQFAQYHSAPGGLEVFLDDDQPFIVLAVENTPILVFHQSAPNYLGVLDPQSWPTLPKHLQNTKSTDSQGGNS